MLYLIIPFVSVVILYYELKFIYRFFNHGNPYHDDWNDKAICLLLSIFCSIMLNGLLFLVGLGLLALGIWLYEQGFNAVLLVTGVLIALPTIIVINNMPNPIGLFYRVKNYFKGQRNKELVRSRLGSAKVAELESSDTDWLKLESEIEAQLYEFQPDRDRLKV